MKPKLSIATNPMNKSGVIAIIAVVLVGGALYLSNRNNDNEIMNNNKTNMTNEQNMMGDKGVLVGGSYMVKNLDIVDNAVNANNLTTLVAAVKAAGLVDTLKGTGPFTVFAPTNDAFEKLPEGTVDDLLKPENKAKLASILTYHVVSGRYTSADLEDGMMLKTVNGDEIKITYTDEKWMVNGAMVETADIASSNGVTFVINGVLLPQ